MKKAILLVEIWLLSVLRRDNMDKRIKLQRLRGCKIGKKCRIFSNIGGAEPYLISIGDNVTISTNVTLLTHDNAIIKISDGKYTDLFGRVSIGDNCFIGANSLIMPGVSLAKGTIVAAGSVVTKSIEDPNMIVGGNPASIIGTAENYLKKNEQFGMNMAGINKHEKKNILKNTDRLIKKKKLSFPSKKY